MYAFNPSSVLTGTDFAQRDSGGGGDSGGGATTRFYYDDWRIIEERNDSDDLQRQNVWGGQYIDELILFRDVVGTGGTADADYLVLRHHNFNVVALIARATGAVVERYDYNPYGRRFVLNPDFSDHADPVKGGFGLAIGHQGLMHDHESGLIYNDARYRHPRLGRFLTADPLNQNQPGGGYHDGMNRYQMLRSNPVNYLDPFGTKATKDAVIVPDRWGHMDFDLDMIKKRYFWSGEWGLQIDQWGGFMGDGGGWITVAATGYAWIGWGCKVWSPFASARRTRSIKVTCTCPEGSNEWFISAHVDPGTPGGKQGVATDGRLSVTSTFSVEYVSQRMLTVTGNWGASITYRSPVEIGIDVPTPPGINAKIKLPMDAYISWPADGVKSEQWVYVCPQD